MRMCSTGALAVAAAMAGSLLLASCGSASPAGDGRTTVVAGMYPFAFVASRVAGGHAAVTNLTSPGAEPHDLELSPQQVATVAEGDVVVYERGLQPAVDDAVDDNAEGAQVDVAALLSGDAGHEAVDVTADPHVWLDPTTLVPVARRVARLLGQVDPPNEDAYRDNAAALAHDLHALDDDFSAGLDDCRRRTFVTSHAAFGHLARRYGLRMVPIAGLSPDTEPSPERLAGLQGVVDAAGVTTIFTETLAGPQIARTLADETGVRTATLDPVEGLSDATADEDYLSLMRANLAALRAANGCR